MLQDVSFFPQSYSSPFSLTFLFWFKCFFYTHYRFHRRQYVWDLIENHDVLSCVCSGIQSHHIEYESVFHIFHTCNDSSSHNQFCLISGFCHFDLSFSIWKSFSNYLHQPRILFLSPEIYLHSIITASHLSYPSCELFRHNV